MHHADILATTTARAFAQRSGAHRPGPRPRELRLVRRVALSRPVQGLLAPTRGGAKLSRKLERHEPTSAAGARWHRACQRVAAESFKALGSAQRKWLWPVHPDAHQPAINDAAAWQRGRILARSGESKSRSHVRALSSRAA